MELHEVCHARRRLAGELAVVLAHPVIAPLLVEFGHHREVVDDMLRQARGPQFFTPLGSWRVAIADRPAERLGEDARIVVQVGRFQARSDRRCDRCAAPGRRGSQRRHARRRSGGAAPSEDRGSSTDLPLEGEHRPARAEIATRLAGPRVGAFWKPGDPALISLPGPAWPWRTVNLRLPIVKTGSGCRAGLPSPCPGRSRKMLYSIGGPRVRILLPPGGRPLRT